VTDYKDIIEQLGSLGTERPNPNTADIDRLTALEITKKINAEDKTVAGVVEAALKQIARAAELFAETLRRGDRVFYIGAGTSGRLGVLDAAECPPTFGTRPEQVTGLIAGGYSTMILSLEGVEDDEHAIIGQFAERRLTRNDMVIGIAASRRTPYTLAGLRHAIQLGCQTAFIICNAAQNLPITPSVLIELPVGPEVITGSTRMKSGTAQKMALNTISTTAMILLGKTYGNMMVDLQSKSEKLAARSRKILMETLSVQLNEAESLLESADGSVKIAIVMHKLNCDNTEASKRLNDAGGFISKLA